MAAYTAAKRMTNALVKFGTTDFSNQITKAVLVPDVNEQSIRTLVPDGVITDVDSAVWKFQLSAVQDHETNGLADYLGDNAGTAITVTFAPVNTTGKSQWTFSAICRAVQIGGSQGEFYTFDVDLTVAGQPTKGTIV